MHVITRLGYAVSFLGLMLVITGCRNDPYYQQSINNLRAEKIQLENQYYLLKNQYESDMRRLGQPVMIGGPTALPGPGGSTAMGGNLAWAGDGSGMPLIEGSSLASGFANFISDQDLEVARYIQDIEVSQLPGSFDESARLLIRPLDDQGDVIPLAGDLKIELVDSSTNRVLANYQYDQQQVAGMIEQRPDQYPGIHLGLPRLGQSASSGQMTCRLQFRTADQRVITRQTELSSAGGMAAAGIPAIQNGMTRQVSTPMSDTPGINDVMVEIGDESNFDSLDDGANPGFARPVWTPDR